jgi:hypothetical protein
VAVAVLVVINTSQAKPLLQLVTQLQSVLVALAVTHLQVAVQMVQTLYSVL